MTVPQPTLYDQLGGKAAIDLAVDRFYEKVLSDPLLAPFFVGLNMAEQRNKQKAFLAMVFGAPVKFTGQSLRDAHRPLVQRGLDDRHFDAVATHLKSTLVELKVPGLLVAQVLAIAASTRQDVLDRPAEQAA